jgi:hypothetical protein
LARVKTRVAEKQEREKIKAALDKKKARIDEIKREENALSGRRAELRGASDGIGAEDVALAGRSAALAKEREALENAVNAEMARELDAEKAKEKAKEAKGIAAGAARAEKAKEDEELFKQGSSKDLLLAAPAPSTDPFSASAPRAVSPSQQSSKGKGRAVVPNNGAVSTVLRSRFLFSS